VDVDDLASVGAVIFAKFLHGRNFIQSSKSAKTFIQMFKTSMRKSLGPR
jgi:hypothetical protein